MKNKLKKSAALAAMTIMLGTASMKAKADDVHFIKGFNDLEYAASANGKGTEQKTINNFDLIVGETNIGYSGESKTYNNDLHTIFNYNRFTISDKDAKNKFIIAVKSDKDGIFDEKAGIRFTKVCKSLNMDYGQLDVLLNRHQAQLDLFCGKMLGKDSSLEIFQKFQNEYGEKVTKYNEVQLSKDIAKNTALFARMEASNFKKPEYFFGVGRRF